MLPLPAETGEVIHLVTPNLFQPPLTFDDYIWPHSPCFLLPHCLLMCMKVVSLFRNLELIRVHKLEQSLECHLYPVLTQTHRQESVVLW